MARAPHKKRARCLLRGLVAFVISLTDVGSRTADNVTLGPAYAQTERWGRIRVHTLSQ